MKKKGVIALIVIIVLAAAAYGVAYVHDYIIEDHENKLLHAAQDVEIGDGVTLLQGIQAYCGETGDWYTDIDDDTVEIVAIGDINTVSIRLNVDLEAEHVELTYCAAEPKFYNSAEDLLSDMIQAAKR